MDKLITKLLGIIILNFTLSVHCFHEDKEKYAYKM